MDFIGAAAPLTSADIREAAKLLGVPENVVRAVVTVPFSQIGERAP